MGQERRERPVQALMEMPARAPQCHPQEPFPEPQGQLTSLGKLNRFVGELIPSQLSLSVPHTDSEKLPTSAQTGQGLGSQGGERNISQT